MTDKREELIEEAAKAMRDTGQLGGRNPDVYKLAEAALAVFEQAHTPTDDEREALIAEADELVATWDQRGSWAPDSPVGLVMRFASYLRRTVQGEPSATCPKCGTAVTDQTPSTFYTSHDETCGGALEEPQGEPSDAAIIAGLRAFFDYENKKPVPNSWALSYWGPSAEQMRRALRAAAATQEGENRG